MRTKTLSCAVMLALFPVVAMGACIKGGPFVCGGSVTINSMPQSENPIWTPPLASPSVTSSGILSAFYTSNMSQANPNSPQPSVAPCPAGYSGSNGTYQWSGKDNTGWVLTGDTGCVAPPPPPPPPVIVQPPVVSTPAVVAVNPSAAAQAAAQQAAAQAAQQAAAQQAAAQAAQQAAAQQAAAQAAQQAAAQQAALASGCPFGKTSTGQYYNFAPIGAETHNTGDASIMPGWVWAGRNTYSCYGS